MPLNLRQQRFVHEYLIDGNAHRAAERAGYPKGQKNGAERAAHRLMKEPEIRAAIQAAEDAHLAKLGANREAVLAEITRLAFYDVRDFVSWKEGRITLKDSDVIGSGKPIVSVKNTEHGIEIKFADKLAALRDLGRTMAMFTDVQKHEGLGDLVQRMQELRSKRGAA